jgi:adenosylcobinamide-phosphate synthase
MAVAAWTQYAGMGGPTLYFGEIMQKPLIGPQGIAWDAQRIRGLIRQTRLAGLLAAACLYLAALAFFWGVRFCVAWEHGYVSVGSLPG